MPPANAKPASAPALPVQMLAPSAQKMQRLFDTSLNRWVEGACVSRAALQIDHLLRGPALITEPHTTTYLPSGFSAQLCADGALLLEQGS